jgi:hypothetical protein
MLSHARSTMEEDATFFYQRLQHLLGRYRDGLAKRGEVRCGKMQNTGRTGSSKNVALFFLVFCTSLCNKHGTDAFHVGAPLVGHESRHRAHSAVRTRPVVAVKGFMGSSSQPGADGEQQARVFELNRGKAVDTLIQDYQRFRESQEMDFSIYSEAVTLVDTQVCSPLLLKRTCTSAYHKNQVFETKTRMHNAF